MKKILSALLVLFFVIGALLSPVSVAAQVQAKLNPDAKAGATVPDDARWVLDPEVTFIGKNAARAGQFLDWTLKNYNWVCVKQVNDRQCNDADNPIAKYWSLIVLYIVVPLLFVVVLATSAVIIITRGKSLTIMRFIPRFVVVVILIVFSYSMVQFLYQFFDLIQGFFLRSDINNPCPPACIQQTDLLYVGWNYETFIGLRLLGDKYAESAFTSLLLTKLTALTYFVMSFLLLVRKIILWFFIIVSPVFPILLLFYPIRNTAKIWIGEFFRWLLYAPLFAIFLNGLVYLWRNSIPLVFNNPAINNPDAIVYPTAVNILLGGPQQLVTPANSVNLVETFALYVVSLIMLWIVILLPWILLQIFLDYASNFSPGDSAAMKALVTLNNARKSPPGGSGNPQSPTGAAINLPFSKKFSIPKNLGPTPTGAAKEINAQGATMRGTINGPAFISTANATIANAEVLTAANVRIPTMRDIAKYDAALMSRDQSKQQETTRITNTLEKIATPTIVVNIAERDQASNLRNTLASQSRKGDLLATSIMNAGRAANNNKTNTKQTKESLSQMANPSLANVTNREKMTKLNEMLKKESTQKGNKLADSILSVNQKTSDKEVNKISSQLNESMNSQMSKSVTSAIQQDNKASESMKAAIQTIANPDHAVKETDKQQVTKVKATLEQASKQGNTLAASILAVNKQTTVEDIEALEQKIQQAQLSGDSVAAEVASLAKQNTVSSLPTINRVQTVSKEDYQAVKDMWKQNYQNLEIPQGMAGSRTDWIKDDISGIDETIALLNSSDQDKVQQGMDKVSSLLPFLLMGGFSQNEIVGYLEAKQDAAKEVAKILATEEDDKVSVTTRSATTQRTMAATMEPTSSTEERGSSSSSDDEEDDSPLTGISSAKTSTTGAPSNASNEVLTMVDLQLPKLRDVAQYETRALQKDASNKGTVDKMKSVLDKIADPSSITESSEREKFEKVRERLLSEQQKGNMTAMILLSAAKRRKIGTTTDKKTVFAQIANPELATHDVDKKRFTTLHDSLQKASEQGNELATAILSTKDATSSADIEALSEKLKGANDEVAQTVLPELPEDNVVPDKNDLQPVSQEEYDEIRKLWEENYRTLPVPAEFGSDTNGRIKWITTDTQYVSETMTLLASAETEKQQQGTDKVSEVMPMLLLGGFSQQEISQYLQAKIDAGKTVIEELQKEEENSVSVSANTNKEENKKVTESEETNDEQKEE